MKFRLAVTTLFGISIFLFLSACSGEEAPDSTEESNTDTMIVDSSEITEVEYVREHIETISKSELISKFGVELPIDDIEYSGNIEYQIPDSIGQASYFPKDIDNVGYPRLIVNLLSDKKHGIMSITFDVKEESKFPEGVMWYEYSIEFEQDQFIKSYYTEYLDEMWPERTYETGNQNASSFKGLMEIVSDSLK